MISYEGTTIITADYEHYEYVCSALKLKNCVVPFLKDSTKIHVKIFFIAPSVFKK